MPDSQITIKIYRCVRCGHEMEQQTNHYGETYSWGRHNTCPACPPFAKYAEFGGSTSWEFVREKEETKDEET